MILQTDNSTNDLHEIKESQKIKTSTPVYKTQPKQEIVVSILQSKYYWDFSYSSNHLIVQQNDFVDEDEFLKAALDNKLPMIKSYLARGADPNACDNVSVYPTHWIKGAWQHFNLNIL